MKAQIQQEGINKLMSIIIFLVIFTLVVVVHEFGHFIIARKNGVKVEEFSIGMGPDLFHIQGKQTKFSVKLLPFGGACMMKGNDMGIPEPDEAGADGEEKSDDDFSSKSVWARISILLAGPLFNFILALVLSIFVVSQAGVDIPVITNVMDGYPAEEAGIQAGDKILELNGEKIYFYRQISLNGQLNPGKTMNVVYERDGQKYTTVIEPKWNEEEQRYLMGIVSGGYYEVSAGQMLLYGYQTVKYNVVLVVRGLADMITGGFSINNLTGPVGVANAVDGLVDEVVDTTQDFGWSAMAMSMLLTMSNFLAMISANLGVMNLLPIPGLDGGRLLFCFIEAVRGKPVAKNKEAMVTFVGFVLLMILMVAVMFNDIKNIVH